VTRSLLTCDSDSLNGESRSWLHGVVDIPVLGRGQSGEVLR
jgi:hypothetical protein